MPPRREPQLSELAITFDIDWAPDWAIRGCADICAEAGVPCTFFVTHETPVLDELRRSASVELGIHPNFLPGSSQGDHPEAVLAFCMTLVPEARAMRSHSLVQSSPLLSLVARSTPIETDVSLLLPFHPMLRATRYYLGDRPQPLIRLPYFWEDDIARLWPEWRWDSGRYPQDGLMIFDFHPIHVALNSSGLERYEALKASRGRAALRDASEADVAPFVNHGAGAATFLRRLVRAHAAEDFHTISGLARGAVVA